MADKPKTRTETGNGAKHRGGHGHFRHVITKQASFADVLQLGGLTQRTFEQLRAEVNAGMRRRVARAK